MLVNSVLACEQPQLAAFWMRLIYVKLHYHLITVSL